MSSWEINKFVVCDHLEDEEARCADCVDEQDRLDLATTTDTALAALWLEQDRLERELRWKTDALHTVTGERRPRDQRTWRDLPWETTTEQAWNAAIQLGASFPEEHPGTYVPGWAEASNARQAVATFVAARDAVDACKAAQEPLQALYREKRWSRFFLVQNTGGHIHRSMSCQTTFPTTQWSWLPDLSGLTEDVAVEQQGPRLCSVCFPSAPVEWTLGLPKKVNPKACAGGGEPAIDVTYRYQTPRGRCAVCGEGVAASRSTGRARPHNKPKGA